MSQYFSVGWNEDEQALVDDLQGPFDSLEEAQEVVSLHDYAAVYTFFLGRFGKIASAEYDFDLDQLIWTRLE